MRTDKLTWASGRVALVVALAAAVLPLIGGGSSAVSLGALEQVVPGQRSLSFGAFVQRTGSQSEQQAVAARETRIGRTFDTVRVFETWEQAFPDSFHTWLRDGGRTPILSVKPVRADGTKITWRSLATAAPGSRVDNEIRLWARRVRDFGVPMYVTLHHEPEASANLAYGTANDYISAWRHWVDVFRAEGATNARFMWIMTDYSHALGTSDRRHAPKWFPGDAWVDSMAIDAYNWHVCRDNQDNAWKTLAQIIEPFRAFGATHPDKEMWLTEWASWDDPSVPGRKAEWIDQARGLFARAEYRQFVGVSYFDKPGTTSTALRCNWSVDSSVSSLASFAAMANDPLWSRRTSGDPVVPDPVPPTAAFASSCSGLQCTVTSQSSDFDGSIVTTDWNFGDGTTELGTNVVHRYASPGAYTIVLTVTDSSGLTATTSRAVVVTEPALSVISFVGQATSNANGTVHRVVVPASVRAGDTLLLAMGSSSAASISGPTGVTGWTLVGSAEAGEATSRMWSKVAVETDADSTVMVTTSSSSKVNLVIGAYRGASASNPIQAVAASGETQTTTSHITPALDSVNPGSFAVWYWTHKDNTTVGLGASAEVTSRSNSSQTGSGRVTGLLADSGISTINAGPLMGRIATAPTASYKATMFTVVLNPA